MNIRIYQINSEKDAQDLMYESYEKATKKTKSTVIDFKNLYDVTWEGNVTTEDLEEIFTLFQHTNPRCPCDFTGRSMSVSDVLYTEGGKGLYPGYYYCDSIGFKEVVTVNVPDLKESKFNLNVVICEPGKKAYSKKIAGDLLSMQKVVDGYIEVYYPFDDAPNICIICNDSGKINNMLPCRAVYDNNGEIKDVIFGTFFVADGSTENISGLSIEDAGKYTDIFEAPEELVYVNGKIRMEKKKSDSSVA